jgi:hypothetical protein
MRTNPFVIGGLSVLVLLILACGGSGGGITGSSGGSSSGGSSSGGSSSGGTGAPVPRVVGTSEARKVRFINLTKFNNIRVRVNGVTIVENLPHREFFDRAFVQK